MRHAGADLHGDRVRALIVMLWRAGLRIQEALSLTELVLDSRLALACAARQGWTPAGDR